MNNGTPEVTRQSGQRPGRVTIAISAKFEAEAVTNGTHILAVLDVS
jgi:hypothetical protein